tara:strand:- start:37431 stop:38627 length:1197 start_codon:yes stop_codon:yes gene_type:complete
VTKTTHALIEQYRQCRENSEALVANLSAEDCQIQAMADVSPMKWHLAHTSWFFETFLLAPKKIISAPLHPDFKVLFNSYYQGIGEQFSRPQRGVLSRPSLRQVMDYRHWVDNHVVAALEHDSDECAEWVNLGIAHEQQHQELMRMDMLYNFSVNPLYPTLDEHLVCPSNEQPRQWLDFANTDAQIGAQTGFSFDNERPRHRVYINEFSIASHLVTNADYLSFIDADGYQRSEFWHSDGFSWLQRQQIKAPLYWRYQNNNWYEFTPQGLIPLAMNAPVRHISFYEASAFAQFKGARLPSEFEWEWAMEQAQAGHCDIAQIDDCAWQWTLSSYQPYPGFRPFAGDAGEYNGKFMVNQQVLRGGSYFTPKQHTRLTYRNFFYPHQRWMCSGIRLAKDRIYE